MSGGFIGVVVPLYLAECLSASSRGKGTGIFQWLLTLGIVVAALIGIYYSYRVEAVARAADAASLFAFKNQAWRRIFWVSLPPAVFFVAGSLLVSESPRWLFRRGRKRLRLCRSLCARARPNRPLPNCAKWKKQPTSFRHNALLGKRCGSRCCAGNT